MMVKSKQQCRRDTLLGEVGWMDKWMDGWMDGGPFYMIWDGTGRVLFHPLLLQTCVILFKMHVISQSTLIDI